jgi:hypothetical protein
MKYSAAFAAKSTKKKETNVTIVEGSPRKGLPAACEGLSVVLGHLLRTGMVAQIAEIPQYLKLQPVIDH